MGGITNKTVHLSFAVDWSKEVNPLLHIRTNNPLERLNREIRRRTRVVGSFPDGHAALMLVAARLRYMAGQKWGTQRYMNMNQEISA